VFDGRFSKQEIREIAKRLRGDAPTEQKTIVRAHMRRIAKE